MKKKNSLFIIKIVAIIFALLTIVLLIPFFEYIPCYFMWDEYGDKYAKEYVSDDGHITFLCNNKLGLHGRGAYFGTYIDSDGIKHEVDVLINDPSYARTENDINTEVYHGDGYYSIYRKAFIIKVDEVDLEYSVYKPGDKIIFRESNSISVD